MTCLAFIDTEKVNYNISRQEMWKVLQRANVSKGLLGRIKNTEDKCQDSIVTDPSLKLNGFKR
jgi:hypothetical protein